MPDFIEKLFDDLEGIFEVKEEETIGTISTGSASLDVSTGIGGIPKGRITEIYGSEGSGKTTISLNTAVNCIKAGGKVLYIDAEQMLDYPTISAMVDYPEIDNKKLVLARPETGEKALQLAEYGINSKEFSLIVFDSIGAIAPEKEMEDELTDANVALTPRLLSKWIRRNLAKIRTYDIAFIFTNQVRDKIGAFMQTFVTPGGHPVKHAASLIISLSPGQKIQQGKEIIGINETFTIKKNKLSSPFKSYTIPIIFGKGVDYYRDLLAISVDLGVVDRKGSTYKFNDVDLGRGANQVTEYLQFTSSKDILDSIIEQVYNKANKMLVKDSLLGEEERNEDE